MPPEYIKTFEPMLMQAPRTEFADVKAILELELGGKLEDHFSEFNEKPVASASLA